ncbi:thiamine pyrophosphate-dependent enzyme [Streptomyces bambusae]|uniref:thiamine pyrophosphate-binding protein n=1 Tax=Streptomyces bambusae TaxID=1550616 RepID=UPI001CFDC1F4|nr:thiamine pyrophosphate-binding protein [Streptomyces bambusae]MCB5165648.1 thiamine pyrophosphate-dependent enzyme [Streptomyces bambusae]
MTALAAGVAKALADSGIRHAFGVVGGGNILATAALTEHGVHYTPARHEGGAMAMADAYYRVSGEVAVCTTTHGPGLANIATPLAEAVKNRSAVVLLCGDAPVAGPRPHDIDQSAFAASLGVPVVRLTDPATAVEQAAQAVRRAAAEQRPVAVFLPGDLLAAPLPQPQPPGTAAGQQPQAPSLRQPADPESVHQVVDILAGARRPLLLAGLGAWRSQAGKIITELGDRLGALYATTVMASGLFHDTPWSLGVCGGFASPPAAELIGEADAVVVFGARLDTFTLHGGRLPAPGAVVIQVDTAEAATSDRVDVWVRGDAAMVAAQLLDSLDRAELPPAGWRAEAEARIAAGGWPGQPHENAGTDTRIDPRTLTSALAPLLPEERTVVTDGGHFIGWPAMYWAVPDPAGLVFTGAAFQSIGLGFAGAVGAAVGRPDRTAVLAVGDGGALMGLSELDTLVRSARSALVVVYDDASYGFEEHMYLPQGADPRTTGFADTDFAGLARALGAQAVTVRTPGDLDAVRHWRADGCRGTLLLDCKIVREVVAPYLADLLGARH